MSKIILKFLIFSIAILSCSAYAFPKEVLNTPNSVAAPSTEHPIFYSLNANRGLLIREKNSEYRLILYHVYDVINYSKPHSIRDSELVKTVDFISKWQKMNPSNIEADISGIQVNNKIFGHTEFYATVFLKEPRYINNLDEITFTLIPIKPSIKMENNYAVFENVTIYINGCSFCKCTNKNKSSIKNCMKN